MGNNYLPNDLYLNKFNNYFEFDNHSLVQFYHRNLAYFIVLYFIVLNLYIFKRKIYFI